MGSARQYLQKVMEG